MNTTLVIMAAGLGSRYGGNKQVDGVGPNNEILMEYSIYDAIRAGFNKVVFIIKPEMEELMHRLCGDYLAQKTAKDGTPFEVAYAFQDFSSIPRFYKIPTERTKPFGTVHALLCAEDVVRDPFCVINADDYYGIDAYQTAFEVEQGATAVAGVDGGVGLDQVGEHAALAADGAAQGRDHARGDGVVEAEGVADGDDGLAGHEVGGIAQGHGGQVMGALDLQHGQVEVRFRALDHGGELAAVLQVDHDLVATGDDVGVGQHQAALAVHDDAGAEAHAFLPAGLVEARAETEKLVHGRDALALHHMGAGDVDDGGGRGLDGAHHRGHARAGIRHGRGGRGRGRTEQGQTGQGACGAAQAGDAWSTP